MISSYIYIYIYIDLLPRRPNPFQFSLELLGLDIVFEHSRYDQQVSTSKKATAVHRTIRSSGRFRASKSFKALIESRSPTRTRLIWARIYTGGGTKVSQKHESQRVEKCKNDMFGWIWPFPLLESVACHAAGRKEGQKERLPTGIGEIGLQTTCFTM